MEEHAKVSGQTILYHVLMTLMCLNFASVHVFLDIDECAVGVHTCSPSESCFNVQGGFRCLSFTCPANFLEVARG